MNYDDGHTQTRLRRAFVLAVAVLVLVVTTEWTLPWSESPAAHGPHVLATAPQGDFAAVVNHAHLENGSTPEAPDLVTAVVMPRVTTALIALGLMVAVVTLAIWWGSGLFAAVRGPPDARAGVLAGRQILTQFCIARR